MQAALAEIGRKKGDVVLLGVDSNGEMAKLEEEYENDNGVDDGFVESGTYQIEVAGEKIDAQASIRSMYDNKNERLKS